MGDHNLQGQQTHTGMSVQNRSHSLGFLCTISNSFFLIFFSFSFSLTPKITLSSAFGRRPCGKSQIQEVLTKQDT